MYLSAARRSSAAESSALCLYADTVPPTTRVLSTRSRSVRVTCAAASPSVLIDASSSHDASSSDSSRSDATLGSSPSAPSSTPSPASEPGSSAEGS